MSIFCNEHKIKRLEDENMRLRKRLEAIEASIEPFRVGCTDYAFLGLYPDTRPTISIKAAVEKIMDHLGLEFKATPTVIGSVTVAKRPKK